MFGYIHYTFRLNIGPDELLRVYQGSAKKLRVRCNEGPVVELDASHLKQFTTADGIAGSFILTTTAEHKVVSLNRAD